jgi:hypothetical protein
MVISNVSDNVGGEMLFHTARHGVYHHGRAVKVPTIIIKGSPPAILPENFIRQPVIFLFLPFQRAINVIFKFLSQTTTLKWAVQNGHTHNLGTKTAICRISKKTWSDA